MGQQWVNDFSLQLEKNIEFGKDDNVSIFFFFFFEIDQIGLSLTWSLDWQSPNTAATIWSTVKLSPL